MRRSSDQRQPVFRASLQEDKMQLISDYMLDENSRHMLNSLTQKVFGFDFEGWVSGGYFEGDYIPYSFIEDGRMLSNVSANRMRFMVNGREKNYIQIGTVMTDEAYRGQGLAAKLINHVVEKYENSCDGIYLFGNLDALGFYKKQGFKTLNQYRYFVKDSFCHPAKSGDLFKPVKELGPEMREKYLYAVRHSACNSSFEQINKYGLQLFYTAALDQVYYAEDISCFAVFEEEDGLLLQSVISTEKTALKDVLPRIPGDFDKCSLGFTPCKEDEFMCGSEIYDGADDYRLFYKGRDLESIETEKLYFPEFSHA